MHKENFKKAVALILSASIATGMSISVFAADNSNDKYVTREYAVSEFVQSIGRNNLKGNENVLKSFDDSDDIDDEYKADFARAASNGVVYGYDDSTLKPKEHISRVEALTILARCMEDAEDIEPVRDAIEFTDVPEWAKEYIDVLSAAGIVEGYGDGKLGTDDMLTAEQLKMLTDRTDDVFNTTPIGESFYGHTNSKTFRNATVESINRVDAKHGAVISTTNAWSALGDVAEKVSNEEDAALKKLMNDELTYEDGSVEQRIHDMLLNIQNGDDLTEDDLALYNDMKTKIISAKSVEDLIDVSYDICNDTGVNPLFDIDVNFDTETNVIKPAISLANPGLGALIAYKKSVKKNLSKAYNSVVKKYATACGLNVSDADVTKAIKLQEEAGKDENYFLQFMMGLQYKKMMLETYTDEDYQKDFQALLKEHPEIDPETNAPYESNQKTYSLDELSNKFKSIDIPEVIEKTGFEGVDKVIVTSDNVMNGVDNFLTSSNLNALKINALVKLGTNLGAFSNKEEKAQLVNFDTLSFIAMMDFELEDTDLETAEESQSTKEFKEKYGNEEEDNDILSAKNIFTLNNCLPNDIGLLYAKYYYDDETTATIQKMVDDIKAAYIKRFENNTWMSDETKQNAIKKVNNIVSNIGYKDNVANPVIVSPENGGTYFNNSVRIKKSELDTSIELAKNPEAIRNMLLAQADTVNAFYAPMFNNITILAGIINAPVYDKNNSYAANLGAIGMVIGHEIGHGFDNSGSQYDEVGRHLNWWTDEDAAKYQEKVNAFEEYYKRFDVVEGIVQDSSITIGENMADFAGMQCVMDILAGDKEAQKEALESYAAIWARLGTIDYISDSMFLNDVHSSNNVRVDAVVASLNEFYDLYDVKEGESMYVASEDRLNLW